MKILDKSSSTIIPPLSRWKAGTSITTPNGIGVNPAIPVRLKWSKPGVGNLSQVAGQKQTQQGMAGRTNFPPTINSVPFSVYDDIDETWEFMEF